MKTHWKWSLPIAACLLACTAAPADDEAPVTSDGARPSAIYLRFGDIEGEQQSPPPMIQTFATLTDDGALEPAAFGADVAALTSDRDAGTLTK